MNALGDPLVALFCPCSERPVDGPESETETRLGSGKRCKPSESYRLEVVLCTAIHDLRYAEYCCVLLEPAAPQDNTVYSRGVARSALSPSLCEIHEYAPL